MSRRHHSAGNPASFYLRNLREHEDAVRYALDFDGAALRAAVAMLREVCFLTMYGRAGERTLLMRIDRERVRLREQAASHVFRAEVVPSGPLDDGEARVPGEIAAKLAALDEWAAKLRGAAS